MAGFVFQVVFSHCVKNGLLEARLIKPWNGCYGPELEEGQGEMERRGDI